MAPPKPDKIAYQKGIEEVSGEIEQIKAKLDILKEKIPSKDSPSAKNDEKVEAKAKFDALLSQKRDLIAKKKTVQEELKTLQAALKKNVPLYITQTENIKNAKSKIGFKSVSDVDQQIAALEVQLQAGGIKLNEEKRIVKEIADLAKTKKQLESLSTTSFDSQKKKLDSLREVLKNHDAEIDQLEAPLSLAMAELKKVEDKLSASRGSLSDLINERKTLSVQLTELKDKKSKLYQDFKLSQDLWYAHEREQFKAREEARKLEQRQQKEEKLLALAEIELENASIPAFTEEITACSTLIKYLTGIKGDKLPETQETHTPARVIDLSSAMPPRATLLDNKRDVQNDFMVLSTPKKNKKSKKSAADNSKPIKLDLESVSQFSKLGVSMPVTHGEIPQALEALKAKKEYFENSQVTQTEANKAAALLKVEKLKETEISEE